jgi:hypothetical protein
MVKDSLGVGGIRLSPATFPFPSRKQPSLRKGERRRGSCACNRQAHPLAHEAEAVGSRGQRELEEVEDGEGGARGGAKTGTGAGSVGPPPPPTYASTSSVAGGGRGSRARSAAACHCLETAALWRRYGVRIYVAAPWRPHCPGSASAAAVRERNLHAGGGGGKEGRPHQSGRGGGGHGVIEAVDL